MCIRPIILAGGSGTRLWPLSRAAYPKQFLHLIDEQYSLFQQTLMRATHIPGSELSTVICNQDHYFICLDEVAELNIGNINYIIEPLGRNTAPAIAIAAINFLEQGEDPYLLVMPSDHLIHEPQKLIDAIQIGLLAEMQNHLVTFGVIPTSPHPGYGYIAAGDALVSSAAYTINSFTEKPTVIKATEYIAAGNYYWNSGIFLFKASVYIAELKRYAEDIYLAAQAALHKANSQANFIRLEAASFAQCPDQSIDIAIMEKTQHGAIIPISAGWSDLGSWNAISAAHRADENNNVICGKAVTYDTHNCFINSEDKLVATVGLDNHLVISTKDSVLVANKNHAESIKYIVHDLINKQMPFAYHHPKVHRPWGFYESLLHMENFQVKLVSLKVNGKISLQLHHHRAEHWVVVQGTAEVICGEDKIILEKNQGIVIPKQTKHRLANIGSTPLIVIETQVGDYLGEDDIVRLEDIYGRL